MRILICMTCKTMENIPDYDGPLVKAEAPGPDGVPVEREVPPEGADAYLDHVVGPHQRGEHLGQLVHVKDEDWDDPTKREEVLSRIRDGLVGTAGSGGFDGEVYALRDTFHEEAMKCYNAHGRPQDGCIDWEDRSKRIGNPLRDDEERTLARKLGFRPKVQFLCAWCPVASHHVQKKKFEKQGLYK